MGDDQPSKLNTQEKIREKNIKFREFLTWGIENERIEIIWYAQLII